MQELIARLITTNAMAREIDETLEQESLTYSSFMEIPKKPDQSEEDHLRENNKEYKRYIAHANATLERIKVYADIIETVSREAKESYDIDNTLQCSMALVDALRK